MTQKNTNRPNYQPESTEDQVRHVLDAGERAARNTGFQTERAADSAADTAGNVVENVKDKASDIASTVKDKASDIADNVQQASGQAAERADQAMSTAGERITDFAQTIRQQAPASGTAGQVATTAADALERSGQYLQQSNLNDVRTDLEGFIRQHPVESLLVGVGVGFLLARMTRR